MIQKATISLGILFIPVFFLFSSLFYSCSGGEPPDRQVDTFELHRGTNIAHWLSQSDARGEQRKAFFTRSDVDTLAALGFDHLRIPVDEEQLWDESMNKHEEAFALLHDAIGWCRDAGLRVVVDLHILRSHHFNAGERPLWTEASAQEQFLDLWRDLSGELKEYSTGLVAYELMNEAVADNPDDWNNLLDRGIATVREQEPERKIVIGSNRWQSVDTFDDLRIPENDTNIILSFHFYHPFAFTHYKASWVKIGEYTGPVHYPGMVVEKSDREGLPEELLRWIRDGGGYYDSDTLRSMMQEPLAFAREHQLPLYCGEFGVYPTAPRPDRLRWYADMIRILEDEGIAWATWCYKGSFGIYHEDGSLDMELVNRLIPKKEQL